MTNMLLACLLIAGASGCSVKRMAVNKVGDALAGSGTTFSADNDPELVRDAIPFSLKLMEALSAESPKHQGLLQAMASGFTQYSYAFVQQEADRLEGTDLEAAWEKQERARKLYLRARDYGMRALELRHRGFAEDLRRDAKAAVALARMRDVPLLYWTAAAWGAAISLSKDNADLIAEIPLVEALMDRAFALEPDFSDGAIHSFYITYEMSRAQTEGDPVERSRKHFEQAVALTKGQQAGPYVAFAESVCVQRQDRQQFETLLRQALAIDVDARPEWRLANIVMQRRANWLLSRAEDLFLAGPEKSEDNS